MEIIDSRLEKLFSIIENGSTSIVRLAAANKIGEAFGKGYASLDILLSKVLVCVKHNDWDCRIAAAATLKSIMKHILPAVCIDIHDADDGSGESSVVLANLNIQYILDSSESLLSGEDCHFLDEGIDKAEQRTALMKHLGLTGPTGFPAEEMFSDEDFQILQTGDTVELGKRKATNEVCRQQCKKMHAMACSKWPLEDFCCELILCLFDASWEVRHGAATGLKELIVMQSAVRGSYTGRKNNLEWLESVAGSLLCVLALDKFGDFILDEVVAPVREMSAQCLAALLIHIPQRAFLVIDKLCHLFESSRWQIRHGAVLGLKYSTSSLFLIHSEESIIDRCFHVLCRLLSDPSDDVCAVASASLLPVLSKISDEAALLKLFAIISGMLNDLDVMASSTVNIMLLLGALLSLPCVRNALTSQQMDMFLLCRNLLPFLYHSLTTVRLATVAALIELVQSSCLASSTQDSSSQSDVDQINILHESSPATATLQYTNSATVALAILQHTLQRGLLEPEQDILDLLHSLWSTSVCLFSPDIVLSLTGPFISQWMCLSLQPVMTPYDESCLVPIKTLTLPAYVASSDGLPPVEQDQAVMNTRLHLASCLSQLISLVFPLISESFDNPLLTLMTFHLEGKSATQRLFAALIIHYWGGTPVPEVLLQLVTLKLGESFYFDEVALLFTQLQNACQKFVQSNPEFPEALRQQEVFTLEQIENIVEIDVKQRSDDFDAQKLALMRQIIQTKEMQLLLNDRVSVGLCAALISARTLPEKFSPIVRPLMDSIQREQNPRLQTFVAKLLAELLEHVRHQVNSPERKVLHNLMNSIVSLQVASTCNNESVQCNQKEGIISLNQALQQTTQSVGRSSLLQRQESFLNFSLHNSQTSSAACFTGIDIALQEIAARAGDDLGNSNLWLLIQQPLADKNVLENQISTSLLTLKAIATSAATVYVVQLDEWAKLFVYITHVSTAIRHVTAQTLAAICRIAPRKLVAPMLKHILPLLCCPNDVATRQGVMECLAQLVEQLSHQIVPYIVLLVVPVMSRCSDQNSAVRMLASTCFAALLSLMPLDDGADDVDAGLFDSLLCEQVNAQRSFLHQLTNPCKIPKFQVPEEVKAELRPYQQQGIDWLWFLTSHGLHGALCDDMGLGKTLQMISVMVAEHKLSLERKQVVLPSLVVCPPTLVGHWEYEVSKFTSFFSTLVYAGSLAERKRLQGNWEQKDIIITSYDLVRNDVAVFSGMAWNFCVLDEGHMIRNYKSKVALSIAQICAQHRFILTGTPIQNNVNDLWALFDFLMPGYLGTQRMFHLRFARVIQLSRDAKSSKKEQEAGQLALQSLHKQVLPFIMRRLKEDVLKDLPPKIMQDYYCDLSPLQMKLYEDFQHCELSNNLEGAIESDAVSHSPNVFQALQYLQRVCNHPALALKPSHPRYDDFSKSVENIHAIEHAPKLQALKQLLLDLDMDSSDKIKEHRGLIFCQHHDMLNVIEQDLLKIHLPALCFMRLDGSVPPKARHAIVKSFNEDPSVALLLMTTAVGGLGLNLMAADTVIFVEHDWNPMRDAQAMDRVHRIGQRKVVNIYRLISRGTLEEKIMRLQKFKKHVANSVITSENSNLGSMQTGQLLDLFFVSKVVPTDKAMSSASAATAISSALEKLCNTQQYQEQYDIGSFLHSLKNVK